MKNNNNYKKINNLFARVEKMVFTNLILLVLRSDIISPHTFTKMIKVNVFGYEALTYTDEMGLTFLDSKGTKYSVYSDCSLEDLIDILNSRE